MTAVPNTDEMVVLHRVWRREFQLLPGLIEQVPEGDIERAQVLAEHLADVCATLHHHHEGEDELLWPLLLAKAAPRAELIHRMEAQHRELTTALADVEQLAPRWRASARTSDRDQLAAAVRRASTVLGQHMDEEEAEILPLVRDTLTVEEWRRLGERGSRSITDKRKRLLFLGMILEDANPTERQQFLGNLPAPVQLLWRLVGNRLYGGYIRTVRAG